MKNLSNSLTFFWAILSLLSFSSHLALTRVSEFKSLMSLSFFSLLVIGRWVSVGTSWTGALSFIGSNISSRCKFILSIVLTSTKFYSRPTVLREVVVLEANIPSACLLNPFCTLYFPEPSFFPPLEKSNHLPNLLLPPLMPLLRNMGESQMLIQLWETCESGVTDERAVEFDLTERGTME